MVDILSGIDLSTFLLGLFTFLPPKMEVKFIP